MIWRLLLLVLLILVACTTVNVITAPGSAVDSGADVGHDVKIDRKDKDKKN